MSTPLKETLREKGWSYRRAARELGVTYQYLSDVCNGHHTSRRLSARIASLPAAPKRPLQTLP